ncbi:MAG: hypothetical protein H0U28_04285 [Nocardioidaceae bacterium]|nr:hypothetical protein [Nocardioidaceae bacterium]
MTSSQELPATGFPVLAVGAAAAAVTGLGGVLKRLARSGARTRSKE